MTGVLTGSAAAKLATPRRTSTRAPAIDVLRGFVMVLMALDHTREFFTNSVIDPLDAERTTFLLYVTRWMTHICAPTFVFLAGTSIFLQQQRKTTGQLTRFLVSRGLWLVMVELTLVHLVFSFHWRWDVQLLEVIWAIGAAMVVMAALIRLGPRANVAIGALLVAGHNLLDGVRPASFGPLAWMWNLLLMPGLATTGGMKPPMVVVAYPLLPWLGVMALGYGFGAVVRRPRPERIRFEVRAGAGLLAAFLLLRFSNFYGDPAPWSLQSSWWRTLLSFWNVQKYPPSLLFVLVTLGCASLTLACIETCEERNWFRGARGVLEVYGRVPLFYFLLHIGVIHLLALTTAVVAGGDWRWFVSEMGQGGVLTGVRAGSGYGLGVVWCTWIGVVALCYPACRWYARVKAQSRSTVLSYL